MVTLAVKELAMEIQLKIRYIYIILAIAYRLSGTNKSFHQIVLDNDDETAEAPAIAVELELPVTHPFLNIPIVVLQDMEYAITEKPIVKYAIAFLIGRTESVHEEKTYWPYAIAHFFMSPAIDTAGVIDIIPARHEVADNLFASWKVWILKWVKTLMKRLMNTVIAGVQKTVQTTGGFEVWAKASTATRANMWKALFDLAPELMATNIWDCLEGYVDFEVIYSSHRPSYVKWQKYIRFMFIALADTVYVYRVSLDGKDPVVDPHNPDTLIQYKKWAKAKDNAVGKAGEVFKQIPKTFHGKLELKVDDLPVVRTGPSGNHRLGKGKLAVDESEDSILNYLDE